MRKIEKVVRKEMKTPLKERYVQFLTLAEVCNVSRAAVHLGVTQPQLTKELKKLEDEVGGSLFERTNRGLILTDSGKSLQEKLTLLEQTWAEIEGEEGRLNSQLRIGAHIIIAKRRVPELFRQLQIEFPSVRLYFSEISSKDASHLVASGDLDLAIAANPEELSGLVISEVARDDLAIWTAAPKDDRSSKNTATLVVNPQLIQYSRHIKQSRYQHLIHVENYEVAAEVALNLNCHALLPSPAVEPYGNRFQKVRQLGTVSINVISASRSRKNIVVSKAREILRSL